MSLRQAGKQSNTESQNVSTNPNAWTLACMALPGDLRHVPWKTLKFKASNGAFTAGVCHRASGVSSDLWCVVWPLVCNLIIITLLCMFIWVINFIAVHRTIVSSMYFITSDTTVDRLLTCNKEKTSTKPLLTDSRPHLRLFKLCYCASNTVFYIPSKKCLTSY